MKKIVLLIVGLASQFYGFAQYYDELMPPLQEGKCCFTHVKPHVFEMYSETYPVFIGEDTTNIEVETIEIILEPERRESVYQWDNKMNYAIDCVKSFPELYQEIVVVKNPHDSIDFVYETFEIMDIVEEGGGRIWECIECELLERRNFSIGYELEDYQLTQDAQELIDEDILAFLEEHYLMGVQFEIYVNTYDNEKDNLFLGQQRAGEISEYLRNKGIYHRRIFTRVIDTRHANREERIVYKFIS